MMFGESVCAMSPGMSSKRTSVEVLPFLDVIRKRARILKTMRAFFDEIGFVEVETPVRIAAPAPETHIDCPPVGTGGYLRASPELQMKKLLACGLDKIYQIGPCFRDGEKGRRHHPEFTMIEWYRRNADYFAIMEDAKALITRLCGEETVFKNVLVRDAYRMWAGWDPWTEWDADRFDFDMAVKIEPALKNEGWVFLMNYPRQAASLAKVSGDYAERWELYAGGMELANCFTELCDGEEQRLRFDKAKAERMVLGEADYPVDKDFLSQLDKIGAAAGVALGVDRLMMTLVAGERIEDVRVVD